MRTKANLASLALSSAALSLAAALLPLPASAGHVAATGYRPAAFYRALLLRHPPRYWFGGTVFTPLAPVLAARQGVVTPSSPQPQRRPPPKTLRVPAQYLEAALHAPHTGPLWVKTARGFRLDESPRP
jgi:hypothetical protein